MAVVVNAFMGRDLVLPEDRGYVPEEHLWARDEGAGVWAVGVTEPGVLLWGGVRQVELLAEPGESVKPGQTVCLLLTSRIRYLAAPVGGELRAGDLRGDPGRDPYGVCLFRVRARAGDAGSLVDAATYARALARSEGARNPSGASGPGSSICKALYWGIRQQRLDD